MVARDRGVTFHKRYDGAIVPHSSGVDIASDSIAEVASWLDCNRGYFDYLEKLGPKIFDRATY